MNIDHYVFYYHKSAIFASQKDVLFYLSLSSCFKNISSSTHNLKYPFMARWQFTCVNYARYFTMINRFNYLCVQIY